MYAGERNGTVERFDTRTPSHQSQKLFDHRFDLSPRSTVLKLDIVQEYGLLLSHVNGNVDISNLFTFLGLMKFSSQLAIYDLRFSPASKAEPITAFEGHVNSYLANLVSRLKCLA